MTGCEILQKISNCQGFLKKLYFSLQWTGKQCQKGWKPFPTKKSHSNGKHTSKTRKQHHKHDPQNRKSTVFTPILHNFTHNPRPYISYHSLSYFIQIPYLSKFRATLFGIKKFCAKCKACSLSADSLWGRQISADNLSSIFNFNNFTNNPRPHILYHRLWYFIQIPYLSKCRATVFGISRFCTKCKACFSSTDSLWGRQISADNLTLIFNFNNFTHNPQAHILYHHLCYFTRIPDLWKCRTTLFGISRICTKCKACFSPTDIPWGRRISADNLTLIFNFNLIKALWFINCPWFIKRCVPRGETVEFCMWSQAFS